MYFARSGSPGSRHASAYSPGSALTWIGIRENLYGGMSGGVVLLVSVVVTASLLLLVVAASAFRGMSGRRRSLAAFPLALLPVLPAGVLSVYVFGEDSYRGNGISRWDAYRSPGGALGPMFVVTIALLCACGLLIFYSCRRGNVRLLRGAALVGGLTSAVLVTATTIGFTAN